MLATDEPADDVELMEVKSWIDPRDQRGKVSAKLGLSWSVMMTFGDRFQGMGWDRIEKCPIRIRMTIYLTFEFDIFIRQQPSGTHSFNLVDLH